MKTIILNWYGPYNDENIKDEVDFGNGLYLITGMAKRQRFDRIQYCGITERTFLKRFDDKNHKRLLVTKNREYWLAEVIYPKKVKKDILELAETTLIYFWQTPLNERKKASVPNPTTLINRWFRIDCKPRIYQQKIYKDLPDVISWDGEYWRTGNLDVYEDY